MKQFCIFLMRIARFGQIFALGALLIVLAVGFVGPHQGMSPDRAGVMAPCLFHVETSSPCQMSAARHRALWQQLSEVLPAAEVASLVAFIAILATAIVLRRRDDVSALSGAYRRYTREHPDINIFDVFRRAVSDGTLHPRLYA